MDLVARRDRQEVGTVGFSRSKERLPSQRTKTKIRRNNIQVRRNKVQMALSSVNRALSIGHRKFAARLGVTIFCVSGPFTSGASARATDLAAVAQPARIALARAEGLARLGADKA
jgi:hypothetical protein